MSSTSSLFRMPALRKVLAVSIWNPNAYMFHTVFEIKDGKSGKVDAEGVARAWQALVDRQEMAASFSSTCESWHCTRKILSERFLSTS
jgi:hypothetical protein